MPPKKAYIALKRDPELHAEFTVARELGMTVKQLRDEMPHSEFVGWVMYLNQERQQEELESKKHGKH